MMLLLGFLGILEAYRSELTEFIELVRAGPESKMHRLEQQAMLRHPNVVRTTIAAEMSWKQGMTVQVGVSWSPLG